MYIVKVNLKHNGIYYAKGQEYKGNDIKFLLKQNLIELVEKLESKKEPEVLVDIKKDEKPKKAPKKEKKAKD